MAHAQAQVSTAMAAIVRAVEILPDAIILVQQMQQRGYRPAGLSLAGATFVPDFVETDNVPPAEWPNSASTEFC